MLGSFLRVLHGFTDLILTTQSTVIIPILLVRKLRRKEVKYLLSKWLNSNPGSKASKPRS